MDIQLLKQLHGDLPVDTLKAYWQFCIANNLNPLARHVHILPQYTQGGKIRHTFHIDVNVLIARLVRNERFRGWTRSRYTVEEKGVVRTLDPGEYSPSRHRLISVTCGCYMEGYAEPVVVTAVYDEWVQPSPSKPNPRWAKAPASMLEKCARAILSRLLNREIMASNPDEVAVIPSSDTLLLADGTATSLFEPEEIVSQDHPPQTEVTRQENFPAAQPYEIDRGDVSGDDPSGRWQKFRDWLEKKGVSEEGIDLAYTELVHWCAERDLESVEGIPRKWDREAYEFIKNVVKPKLQEGGYL